MNRTQLIWSGLGLLLSCACGDAYSTHVPEQKVVVPMDLNHTTVYMNDLPMELFAYVFTPSENHYFVEFDFGPGLAIIEYDAGSNGCEKAKPYDEPIPNLWETTHVFPICVTIEALPSLQPNDRTLFIDVESDGIQIRAHQIGFRIRP